MSSVFKSPKVKTVQPQEVEPVLVDNNETVFQLEKKRKKKMGAVSQILSLDRENSDALAYRKTTLGA